MTLQTLGRFGHHPDPAIDFEVEVQGLEAEAANFRVGFQPMTRDALLARISRAMDFRVGAVPTCVTAKQSLRNLEAELMAKAAS